MDFIDILHEEWLFCCTGAANAVQELPPQISQFVLPQHHNYTVSTSSLYQWPEVEEWLLHLLVQTSRCLYRGLQVGCPCKMQNRKATDKLNPQCSKLALLIGLANNANLLHC